MTDKKKIDDKKLAEVNGGGFFSKYSDDEYAKAGVTVIGPGVLYNDGYEFRGQSIDTDTANKLAFFYYMKDYPADSIQEAEEYYDYYAMMNMI